MYLDRLLKNTDEFYRQTLTTLLAERQLGATDRILVVCGGQHDRDVLHRLGFTRVTLSNLDTRMEANAFSPFEWSFQDAEKLEFADQAFDFCLEHSGLHHCYSPHRALLEMYRVSRRGILLFEPYDNLVTRLGLALNLGQEFEHAAVFYNNLAFGGVRNTAIPNYIYRWTKREIIKTITCVAPHGPPGFRFFHQLRVPWGQLKGRKNPLFLWSVILAWPLLKLFSLSFPAQSNGFAAFIRKPSLPHDLYPWLSLDGQQQVALNHSWLNQRYRR
jgi:SAM-dependent methyltransferase